MVYFIQKSAWKSYLKKLDPIHLEGLSLLLGAFSTSSFVSLYTKTYEAPIQLKGKEMALQYETKLKCGPSDPAYDCIFNIKYKQHHEQKKTSNHLAFWLSIFSKNQQFLLQMYIKAYYCKYHLGSLKKHNNPPIRQTLQDENTSRTYLAKLQTILLHHPGHQYIFTNGSKDSNKTSCTTVLNLSWEMKFFNHVQTNEILLIKNFTY